MADFEVELDIENSGQNNVGSNSGGSETGGSSLWDYLPFVLLIIGLIMVLIALMIIFPLF